MSSKIKTFLKYFLTLIIGIGLLWYFLSRQKPEDLQQAKNAFIIADYYWLGITVVISIIEKGFRAQRWNLLLEPVGYKPPLKNTIIAVMIAYFANVFAPRMGEVARCGILNRTDKVPIATSFGTVVAERAIDFICLLILIAASLFFEYEKIIELLSNTFGDKIGGIKSALVQNSWILLILVVLVVVSLLFLYSKRERIMKNGFVLKLKEFGLSILAGLLSVLKLKRRGEFVLYTVLIWTSYFLMTYLAFFSLPATAGLGLSAALVILVVGGLGMSAPVQAGIGAFHFFIQKTLFEVYHIEKGAGLSYAFLVHTSQTATMLITGLICFIISINIGKRANLELQNANIG
jgi:hypothetical protein